MCSFWRKLLDLTWAHSAMFTGAQFNQTLKVTFSSRYFSEIYTRQSAQHNCKKMACLMVKFWKFDTGGLRKTASLELRNPE